MDVEPEVEDEVLRGVVDELTKLRGDHGRLTVHKFARYQRLIEVCGDGDLLDGFLAFKRELERLKTGNKYEAAVAWSIAADTDTVLDRLQATADALSVDKPKDQRTARHWSDRGMESVARDLIAFGTIRGHLGRDLIGIVVLGSLERGLRLRVVQVASTTLRRRAPVVTVVQIPDRDGSTATDIDLRQVVPDYTERTEDTVTQAHVVTVELAQPHVGREERLATVSVMGRGSPTPSFFLEDWSSFAPPVRIAFGVHRSLVVVEVVAEAGAEAP